jgi:hypothetical protein
MYICINTLNIFKPIDMTKNEIGLKIKERRIIKNEIRIEY